MCAHVCVRAHTHAVACVVVVVVAVVVVVVVGAVAAGDYVGGAVVLVQSMMSPQPRPLLLWWPLMSWLTHVLMCGAEGYVGATECRGGRGRNTTFTQGSTGVRERQG